MNVVNRDNAIDVLRALGLFFIFISHSQPESNAILQLRCFDVPMMVFISGLTCSGKKIDNYSHYCYKRTLRLVAPVWIFLSVYFCFLFMVQGLGIIPVYLTYEKAIESYLLLDGIGYVWIIRVFLLIMLITPLLCNIERNKGSLCLFFIIILFLIITEAIVKCIPVIQNPHIEFLVKNYIVYAVGYSALFILGLRLRTLRKKDNIMIIMVFLLFISVLAYYLYQNGVPIKITPDYKFPPRLYYLIYGMFMSMILWITRKYWIHLFDNNFIRFVGKNTIWIYLWHMPFVLLSTKFDICFFRFAIISLIPLFIYYVQYKCIKHLRLSNEVKKILIG